MEKISAFDRLNNWARKSVSLKLFTIGFLILILLIPLFMLTDLIQERENLRDGAIKEISSKWGDEQTVGGPVLTIPYKYYIKDEEGNVESRINYAHFLPDQLTISGQIAPEKRKRGIYMVVLYNTKLAVTGTFKKPYLDKLNVSQDDFIFEDAFVSLGITDMKGIKENISLQWNDSSNYFNPGIVTHDIFESGISVPVHIDKTLPSYNFSFALNINGSKGIHFLPIAKETNVSLTSTWDNPSFQGAFLPDTRTVDQKGFTSHWKILQLNRNYAQQGLSSYLKPQNSHGRVDHLQESSFGVNLLLPIDEYQKTMRSAKYGVMFILLTFLAFFFIEVLNKKRIHSIQYLLIGFSICLFYILLLSLSEHLSFNISYLISCIVIISLNTFYYSHILKNRKLTYFMSGALIILYGFFYSLLQLQDYSLLVGSFGLLLILGVIMYLTRNIDWFTLRTD
ncbi:MAG: cell envelope integrity protein CreD [Bacteroidota bacterium]|nr:cell envelope integrity protein CreD [Bacteroidota bacterium]